MTTSSVRFSLRTALKGFFTLPVLTSFASRAMSQPNPRQVRVAWVRLTSEVVGVGDFWFSDDPNTPERQLGDRYNLQGQAVGTHCIGKPACTIGIGNGAFWRPTGLVPVKGS